MGRPSIMGFVVFTASVAAALFALSLADTYLAGGKLRAVGVR